MIFLLRGDGPLDAPPQTRALCSRATPAALRKSPGSRDLFVAADRAVFTELVQSGAPVAAVKDGWYEDGAGGGVAVWGAGQYWEVRRTPFEVVEASGFGGVPEARGGSEMDVRGAIFGSVP